MTPFLAANVEVVRSSATVASTFAGAAAAVSFAALGLFVVASWRRTGDGTRRTRVLVNVVAAVVLVATGVEVAAYLVEQVRLTAGAMSAVATSARSLTVIARMLSVALTLAVVHGRKAAQGGDSTQVWDVLLAVTSVAALATALLDPVGAATWRSVVAVVLGVGVGIAVLRPTAATRWSAPVVAAGGVAACVAAVVVVLSGGVSDGWSARLPTDIGIVEIAILPATPDAPNEIHVIAQPDESGVVPHLNQVTFAGAQIQGPDPSIPPSTPFELFLVSPDHAIAYGVEVSGDGPWGVVLGLETDDGRVDVPLDVERQ